MNRKSFLKRILEGLFRVITIPHQIFSLIFFVPFVISLVWEGNLLDTYIKSERLISNMDNLNDDGKLDDLRDMIYSVYEVFFWPLFAYVVYIQIYL